MLVAALTSMFIFAIVWLFFSAVAYSFIYGSLIFAYLFIWDDQTRKEICPKGLLHAIMHDC